MTSCIFLALCSCNLLPISQLRVCYKYICKSTQLLVRVHRSTLHLAESSNQLYPSISTYLSVWSHFGRDRHPEHPGQVASISSISQGNTERTPQPFAHIHSQDQFGSISQPVPQMHASLDGWKPECWREPTRTRGEHTSSTKKVPGRIWESNLGLLTTAPPRQPNQLYWIVKLTNIQL